MSERKNGPEPPPSQGPPSADLAANSAGDAAQARADELRRSRSWAGRLAALFGARNEARSFAFGAQGERIVGRKLDRWAARDGWHVLHAVPVGRRGADIDHVLIGRFGVVTINTKRTRGRVWVAESGMVVNGTKVDYLRNSRHEAKRARELMATALGRHVPVHPVIVFVGAKGYTVKNGGPRDVTVLPRVKGLRRWLRRQGPMLTDDQVAALYTAARDPAAWQRR